MRTGLTLAGQFFYNSHMKKEPQPKLRLAPPEPDIGETDGFAKSDIFGYAEFGGRLANIARNLQTPLVLALTGGWGSGKSVFAKQWAGELRKKWAEDGDKRDPKDAPVIYFDAFANDHQDNALLALAGEVMKFVGRRKGATAKAKESAKRIAKGVGFVMAEGAARYATHGLVGLAGISCAMESALEKRMKEAEQGRDAIRDFRNALKEAAKELGGGQPLVFIVDELDRCRPDFALELLEKIKHLFSVPNVCFLVVTNLEQFKAVVQRAYGYNADEARVYLDKFFQRVFWLPEGKTEAGQIAAYVCHLWGKMGPSYDESHRKDFTEWLTKLAEKYDFSLRGIERVFANVVLACAAMKSANPYLIFALAGLCVMRQAKSDLYRKAISGKITVDEMREFMDWDKMGNVGDLPDFVVHLITGKGKRPQGMDDSQEWDLWKEKMPQLAKYIEGFDVRNQFWQEGQPPAPVGD